LALLELDRAVDTYQLLSVVEHEGPGIAGSELMSIASYLALPALERLIRTVVVLDEKNHFGWYDDENKKRKRE